MVFAEKQPFKGVENYFNNALLYQEANDVAKELLLEDDDSDNEADSESEEDTPATFTFKSIIAYFNDPKCNNLIEHDGEWMINENVTFDYPVIVDLFKSVDNISLHMPLSMLSVTSTPVESEECSVFVIHPSKRSQSPIIFGKVQPECLQLQTQVQTQSPHKFFIMHDQCTI